MERRKFLRSSASLAIGAMGLGAESLVLGGTPVPIRKSINGLPATDTLVANYSKAVALMKNLPASDPRNWRQQANIHNNYCPHTNWWFLPWHRAYLYYFEDICRNVLNDPSFTLPYWNWTAEPRIPDPFLDHSSPLWDSTRNKDGKIQLGVEIVGPNVIRKIVTSGALGDLFSGPTTSDTQREGAITGLLEGTPHNGVHGTILGDMGNYMSPLDPIFWLHHCNVDRIWASWARLSNIAPTANLWRNHALQVFYDPATKQHVTPPTADTVNAPKYRALYDDYETAVALNPSAQPFKGAMFGLEGKFAILPQGLRQLGFAGAVNKEPSVGRAQTISLAVPADFTPLIQDVVSARAAKQVQRAATYLLIEAVPRPTVPSTALRVFLNCKDPSLQTPLSDPTYVGTVAFFGAESPSMAEHADISFSLNVTDALSTVANAGTYRVGAPIDVGILPVDLASPDRTAPAEVLKPRSLRLVGLETM
jgi:tyrosinase